jgi:hypothetical protein
MIAMCAVLGGGQCAVDMAAFPADRLDRDLGASGFVVIKASPAVEPPSRICWHPVRTDQPKQANRFVRYNGAPAETITAIAGYRPWPQLAATDSRRWCTTHEGAPRILRVVRDGITLGIDDIALHLPPFAPKKAHEVLL